MLLSGRGKWNPQPDFVDAFLELHNRYRETHNSPPVEIIDKLNELAQEWAARLARRGVLAYKSDPEYGENIFTGFLKGAPENVKPEDLLERWYCEGRYFKYGEETVENVQDVRHFTQLVWKGSTSIGIGMATDSDGETYFVCLYQPPGNVSGEFAANVESPFKQKDVELLEHEAEGIQVIEIKPKVVASMERLYAVPSEKLRVWSVWLAKIGEIAGEWQRWLRSNIDLVVRIAEHLEADGEATRRSKMDGDKPGKVRSEVAVKASSQSVRGESGDPEIQKSIEKSQHSAATGNSSAEYEDAIGEAMQQSVTSVQHVSKDNIEEPPASVTSFKPENDMPMWPLGIPWTPQGEQEDEEEALQKLPIPRNKEEMEEFVKNFTREAAMYRSYYKHWRETADQTMKEVGGRSVMATFIVQGKREQALKRIARKKGLQKSRSIKTAKPSKTIVPSKAESSKTSRPKSPDVTPSPSEAPTVIENVPSKSGVTPSPSKTPTVIENVPSKAEIEEAVDESLEVDELFRDCARSAEPVPYHFYLTAEPDVEIGTEDDDENDEVVEADTVCEKMADDIKRLYFNLAEKPCKGGKPWI